MFVGEDSKGGVMQKTILEFSKEYDLPIIEVKGDVPDSPDTFIIRKPGKKVRYSLVVKGEISRVTYPISKRVILDMDLPFYVVGILNKRRK